MRAIQRNYFARAPSTADADLAARAAAGGAERVVAAVGTMGGVTAVVAKVLAATVAASTVAPMAVEAAVVMAVAVVASAAAWEGWRAVAVAMANEAAAWVDWHWWDRHRRMAAGTAENWAAKAARRWRSLPRSHPKHKQQT